MKRSVPSSIITWRLSTSCASPRLEFASTSRISSYVSAELRRRISERADRLCEYCLVHEDETFFGCQVDHVISEKHGSETVPDNLSFACAFCNRSKGTDIGSLSRRNRKLTRFFNPRSDRWADHFRLDAATILPLTEIGEVTATILGFNSVDRILERNALIEIGRYPSRTALRRMRGEAGT